MQTNKIRSKRKTMSLPAKGYTPMPKSEAVRLSTSNMPWYKQFWVMITSTRQIRLTEDYIIWVESLNMYVRIPAGFVCDLASIPRLLWPLIPPDGIFMIGGIIHDFCYRYRCLLDENLIVHHAGMSQSFADRVFLDVNIQVNDMPILDSAGFGLMKIGSWVSWRKHRKNGLWVGDFFKYKEDPDDACE